MLPQDGRSPVQQQRWIDTYNVGSQTIPPHGACEVTGTVRGDNDRTILLVQRPTKDSSPVIVFNGLLPVPPSKDGYATNDHPAFCLGYIPTGVTCGSQKDSFQLAPEKSGFVSLGVDSASGLTRVKEAGAEPEQTLVLFQLTGTLVLGGIAPAVTLAWNGATGAYIAETAIQVMDPFKDSGTGPGAFVGKAGYRGWARKPKSSEGIVYPPSPADVARYPIVFMEHQAEFIRFKSTEDMGKTTASQMQVTVVAFTNGKDPSVGLTAPLRVHDPDALFRHALKDADGLARWDDKTGQYIVVECDTKAGYVVFSLLEDRSTGAPAEDLKASIADWGGTQQDIQKPTFTAGSAGAFKVSFRAGQFPYSLGGADGVAHFDATVGKYYAVVCNQRSIHVQATLKENLCGRGNADLDTNSGKGVDPWPFSQDPRPADLLVVRNPHALKAQSFDVIDLKWNESLKLFTVDEVDWYDQLVMKGLEYDSVNCQIKAYFTTVSRMECGEVDGDPIPQIQLHAMSVVRGARLQSEPSEDPANSTCKLQTYEQVICSFDEADDLDSEDNAPVWTDVASFTATPVLKAEEFTNADGLYWKGIKTFVFSPCPIAEEEEQVVNLIPTTDKCEAPPP